MQKASGTQLLVPDLMNVCVCVCMYVYLKVIAIKQVILLFALQGHQAYFLIYENVCPVLLTCTLPAVISPNAKPVPGD
jgi:hypothetical protein